MKKTITRDELIARWEGRKLKCEQQIRICDEQINFLKKEGENKKKDTTQEE